MLKTADIFMTGGAGTLGKAIARRRTEQGWTGKLTVYSTDAGKHNAMRALYPDVNYIQGDIRSIETMKLAMVGHDLVIHAAAVKFIPDSEVASIDTVDVNVYGSEAVCDAARWAGVSHVLGISTDKACHPANAYGSSKHLMEKIFQEHARYGNGPIFNLVRYGNVLESRGSVVESWRNAVAEGRPIRITDAGMTRFWLSPSQAVDYVEESLKLAGGRIYIPRMPALAIGKLLAYVIDWDGEKVEIMNIPMRPGEKMHETLLTDEEMDYAEPYPAAGGKEAFYSLHPSTDERVSDKRVYLPYTSDTARELTKEELDILLAEC